MDYIIFLPQKKKTILFSILFAAFSAGLFFALSKVPLTVDYTHYSMSARAFWMRDSRLYDANTHSYYYMPWGMLIAIPLSFLPDSWGQAMLIFLSLGGVLLSQFLLVERPTIFGVVLVFLNLYTINMVFSGQWDGISIGACALAWWSISHKKHLWAGGALLLLTAKPTNMILVTILLGVYILKNWKREDIFKAGILPLITLGVSFVFCGFDWPWRYIHYLQISPPPQKYNLSLWHEFSWKNLVIMTGIFLWFVIIVWKRGINQLTLSLGMVTNIIISPYVLSYHFLGTSPTMGVLAKRHWLYAFIPWLLMIYHTATLVNISLARNFIGYPVLIGITSIIVWRSILYDHPDSK